jgi:hypothetical protein
VADIYWLFGERVHEILIIVPVFIKVVDVDDVNIDALRATIAAVVIITGVGNEVDDAFSFSSAFLVGGPANDIVRLPTNMVLYSFSYSRYCN